MKGRREVRTQRHDDMFDRITDEGARRGRTEDPILDAHG